MINQPSYTFVTFWPFVPNLYIFHPTEKKKRSSYFSNIAKTQRPNLRQKTVAVLLDVEKSFNKVWHSVLVFKLIAMDIPTQLVNIIRSFLGERSFHIKVSNTSSSNQPIESDVPQGFWLFPQLFSIDINDLPVFTKTNVALITDDTLLYIKAKSNNTATKNLQCQLNNHLNWYNDGSLYFLQKFQKYFSQTNLLLNPPGSKLYLPSSNIHTPRNI